jgi:hypothetical protein
MRAPWFKFYAADYMSSLFVQGLEPEQELWYLRLIIASAINLPRGCLPLANGKLWRLAKAPSLEHFEKYAGPILAKFEKDETAGLYRVSKVAEQQLVANADLSNKRSQAGKLGAAKRWQVAMSSDKADVKKAAFHPSRRPTCPGDMRIGGWLSGNRPFRSIAKRMSISSDSWFQGTGR